MVGTGTIANVLAIVAGGSLGLLAKGGMKQHYQDGIIKALALPPCSSGPAALAGMLTLQDGEALLRGHPGYPIYDPGSGLGTLVGSFSTLTAAWSSWGPG